MEMQIEAQLVDMQNRDKHMLGLQFIGTNEDGEKIKKFVPICMVEDKIMQLNRKAVYDFSLGILKQILGKMGIDNSSGTEHDYRDSPITVDEMGSPIKVVSH